MRQKVEGTEKVFNFFSGFQKIILVPPHIHKAIFVGKHKGGGGIIIWTIPMSL